MADEPCQNVVFATPEDALAARDTRLVDLVDGLLEHGVVLHGEVWLSVADIDLVYLGLSAVLTTPDKILAEQECP